MIRRISALMVVTMLLTVAATSFAAEKVTLKQKFEPGTRWMTTTMNIDQTMSTGPTGAISSKIQQMMVMKMVVEKPNEQGEKTLTMTYERIVQNMSMGKMMNMSFDSAAPDDKQTSPMAQFMKPLVGSKIVVILDKDDKVKEIKGLDEMFGKIGGNAGMAAGMKKSFGDNAVKSMISQSQKMMPTQPVAVGESWKMKDKIEVPVIGELNYDIDLKLIDVSKKNGKNVATIEFSGMMTGTPQELKEMPEMPGGKMELKEMKMTQKGQILFDIDAGRAITTDADQSMTMSMDIQAGEMKNSMNMKQAMKMLTTDTGERNTAAEEKFLPAKKAPQAETPAAEEKKAD